MKRVTNGFTIIELLIVIAIIGILTTIGLVSFDRIRDDSTNSQRESKMRILAEALEKYYQENGEYPSCGAMSASPETVVSVTLIGMDPDVLTAPTATSGINSIICTELPAVSDNFAYLGVDCVEGVNGFCGGYSLDYPNAEEPITGQHQVILVCPIGFILVPGSATYNTDDFCVMKYEAKNVDGVATSQAAGTPWVNITQANAVTTAAAACTGCQLITEDEWMTIAQNVLGVSSNWTTGTVGSGEVYRGHSDGTPTSPQPANPIDGVDDWYLTENGTTGDQRRTLTLSNSGVIWDLAGNARDWTQGVIAANQQPGLSGDTIYNMREWTASLDWHGLPASARPSSTGIANADSWNSANGIGKINCKFIEATDHVYARGGDYSYWSGSGVLAVNFSVASSNSGAMIGFRATVPANN